MNLRVAFAVAVLVLVTGCQSSGERVETDAPLEAVEVLRIGQLDGPDEYMFGSVMDIAVGPDGDVYVADRQLELVREYAADGTFVRDIGRRGEAPGEYYQLLGVEVTRDGSLAVLSAPQRITIYDRQGEYVRDFRVDATYQGPDIFNHDVDGNFYIRDVATRGPQLSDDWAMVYVKVSPDGTELGRIPIPLREPSGPGSVLYTSEGAEWFFATMTVSAWSPLGYLVVGRNDDYTIERRDTTGVLGSFRHDWTPVALTAGEASQWRAWSKYLMEATHSTDGPEIPEVKPVFKDIHVGDDGTIWVRRYASAVERDVPPRPEGDERPLLAWRDRPTYDAFDPEGTFLGTVVTPEDVWVVAFHGRRLWGVGSGSDGPQVVELEVASMEVKP